VRQYEELSRHGGQRALGHTHHHHQKRKDRVNKLEGPERNAAVGEVAALEDKESKSLENKSSDLKKVLSDCPGIRFFNNIKVTWTNAVRDHYCACY